LIHIIAKTTKCLNEML